MGESDSLFRSDILICDWSAMAIEYALGLEKPVLFIDLPRRVRNPDWRALDIEPLEAAFRKLAGDIVSPQKLDEVPQKIDQLAARPGEFQTANAETAFANGLQYWQQYPGRGQGNCTAGG